MVTATFLIEVEYCHEFKQILCHYQEIITLNSRYLG